MGKFHSHYEISLSLAELHLLFQSGAEGVQGVSTWNSLAVV